MRIPTDSRQTLPESDRLFAVSDPGAGMGPRRRHLRRVLAAGIVALVLTSACSAGSSDGGESPTDEQSSAIALNEIQVLGTHNSYHVQPREEIFTALEMLSAELAASIEYSHAPLDEQLTDYGIRQFELDVFADPQGGKYASRAANPVVGLPAQSDEPALDEPGFKVLHTQDFDYETTCLTLVACLEIIHGWSEDHPDHVPVMVMIEGKEETIEEAAAGETDLEIPDLGFAEPLKLTPGLFDDLDDEIRSVFPDEQLITPDDVRAGHATLEEAVLEDGWPSLTEARGKLMFALVNTGGTREVYLEGHEALAGRVMFTSSEPGRPDAAFVRADDPIEGQDEIQELVRDGYLVRTRADVPTEDARSGDTTRRDAALTSGAQFVSTDYPVPDPDFESGYVVTLPDATPARCNPINAPSDCTPELIAEES